jgi:thiol-disulfide isomerase/thioredoxin
MRLPTLLPVIAIVLAFAASGCQRSADLADAGSTPSGRPVAESHSSANAAATQPAGDQVKVMQLDFDGIEQLVASHKGRVVVMDAWSLACPPCVQEFPKLVALQGRYPREQLACISLSFDYEGIGEPAEKLPRVEAFLEKQKANFDNVLASEESDVLYRKFHLLSVPAVFVYDKTGKLRRRFDNQQAQTEAEMFTYEDVERLVVELLGETPDGEVPQSAAGSADKTEAAAG